MFNEVKIERLNLRSERDTVPDHKLAFVLAGSISRILLKNLSIM
jgi:hypothetical protein